MKTSLFLSSALGVILLTGTASAAVTKYKATLNGAQEVPALGVAGTGAADLSFDDADNTLIGTVTYTGLTGNPTAAHVHTEVCGKSGGVAFAMQAGNAGEFDVDETLSAGQVTDLKAGKLYANIHTAANGGGEIRGQLFLEGSTDKCPAGAAVDAGSSGSDAGSSGTSGGTSGSTNDAGTTKSSSGSTAAPAEDEGCSTSGSAPGSGLAIAFGVGLAVAAISSRGRRKQK